MLAKQLHPELVLLDISMPDGDGLQAAAEIHRCLPEVKIVILTASLLDEHFREAIQIGVSGYLLKDLDAEELFDLIEGLDRGEAALTRTMAMRLLKHASGQPSSDTREEDALTEREIEVLRILAQGASNPQIARELNITVNTVKSHISHILSKLELENRTQAAAYAVEKRLT